MSDDTYRAFCVKLLRELQDAKRVGDLSIREPAYTYELRVNTQQFLHDLEIRLERLMEQPAPARQPLCAAKADAMHKALLND